MANIGLVETSLRDGNQSLWGATGMNTAMMLSAAPIMERVGFKAIDFTTSTHMAVAARFTKEDPWDRIRGMAALTPKTPLQFLTTGFRFISWETASPEFMDLVYATLIKNGIRRFAVADPMNDMAAQLAGARMIKAHGGEHVICALTYSISPVHDDAHYIERARGLAASQDVDALYIKDPGGLLTPLRAQTLIPAIKQAMGAKPLELHAHCTIGLADLVYMDAPNYGVTTLQCATGAAADGTSNPPVERTVSNLRALGHTVEIDDKALAELTRYMNALAEAEGLPFGKPQGFNAAYLRHQLPGGVVGTMRRHLTEARLADKEQAVIEELARVREELGWPIVMTPFAQMVVTQATMNVMSPERYAVIPDEVIRYAIGRFGRPNIPLDPNVMDRIESLPRTKELRAEPLMAPLSDLRRRIGPNLSDEEFLLRATMPGGQVDTMMARGPAPRVYDPSMAAVLNAVREAVARTDISELVLEKPGFKLQLNGRPRSNLAMA